MLPIHRNTKLFFLLSTLLISTACSEDSGESNQAIDPADESGTTPDESEKTTPEGSDTTPNGVTGTTPEGSDTTPNAGTETTPEGSDTTPDGGTETTPEGSDGGTETIDAESTDPVTTAPVVPAALLQAINEALAMDGEGLLEAYPAPSVEPLNYDAAQAAGMDLIQGSALA